MGTSRNENSASRDARATCENVCSHMVIVASTLGKEIWPDLRLGGFLGMSMAESALRLSVLKG